METEYIFISPHLDDAVLSCGELIYKLVNNKAIVPSEEELEVNPRARSAKLRVIERIK